VAFDFWLINLLILCYFCLFVTTKCYLFLFSFHFSITLLFLSFLSSSCLFMFVYVSYSFISFLNSGWVMPPVWLWLECGLSFCNWKWEKCFCEEYLTLAYEQIVNYYTHVEKHYTAPWYWEEEDKKVVGNLVFLWYVSDVFSEDYNLFFFTACTMEYFSWFISFLWYSEQNTLYPNVVTNYGIVMACMINT